jgi:carbamoyltransferase
MDIAASVQAVTEEVMMRTAAHVHGLTGDKNLCLAGGVALNCVGNGKILREGPFENIWIQPAAGDAGGALGAALFVRHQYLGNPRRPIVADSQKASYLGPEFSDEEIRIFLDKEGVKYKQLDRDEIPAAAGELIASEKVVGWFQGKMEFGPRALGGRSIIGDARSPTMQSVMNLKIKFRESFRPFAPTVLADRVSEYFELDVVSPYMLLVAPVREKWRRPPLPGQEDLKGVDKLKIHRSEIPAVTHVDFSARIQTVSRKDNPLYYDAIAAFEKITGCPVIINTSFNVRGEPIVCTPQDAYVCFMRTNIDYLLLGSFLLDKKEQKPWREDFDWRKHFRPD